MPIEPKANDEYAHLALMDKTKYVRILKREVRGKVRYFVQLIQEGYPPIKRNRKIANDGTKRVGIDIGSSTIAISSENTVELRELAPECHVDEAELRRIQRAKWIVLNERPILTISKNNGTVKKGRWNWNYSTRYKKLRQNTQRTDIGKWLSNGKCRMRN